MNVKMLQKETVWLANVHTFWIDHRRLDLPLAILLGAVHLAVVQKLGYLDLWGPTVSAERRQAYSAATLLVGLIGAFSGVGIAQLASTRTPAIQKLKKTYSKDLVANWLSIYRGALLAGLISILCLLIDVQASHRGRAVAPWLFEVGVFFAVVKFVRLGELFAPVVASGLQDDEESDDSALEPAAEFDPDWNRQSVQTFTR